MFRPDKVNIMGKVYKISYVDSPSEVDIYRRESLWGQIDYWTRSIRVYANDRTEADILDTIIHEIIHGIAEQLHLKINEKDRHEELDILAVGLADTFVRNEFIKI